MTRPVLNVKPLVGELAYIYGVTLDYGFSSVRDIMRDEREQLMVRSLVALRTQGSKIVSATWRDTSSQPVDGKDSSLCPAIPGDNPGTSSER